MRHTLRPEPVIGNVHVRSRSTSRSRSSGSSGSRTPPQSQSRSQSRTLRSGGGGGDISAWGEYRHNLDALAELSEDDLELPPDSKVKYLFKSFSGIPKVTKMEVDQDIVMKLMIELQFRAESEKRWRLAQEKQFQFDPYNPLEARQVEFGDEEHLREVKEYQPFGDRLSEVDGLGERVEGTGGRKSWPLSSRLKVLEDEERASDVGLETGRTVDSSTGLMSPFHYDRPRNDKVDRRKTQGRPDSCLLPEHLYQAIGEDVPSPATLGFPLSKNTPVSSAKPEFLRISTTDALVGRDSEVAGPTSSKTVPEATTDARAAAFDEMVRRVSYPQDTDRYHNRQLSEVSSEPSFIMINTVEPIPHILSPWAEDGDLRFLGGESRFVEQISSDERSQQSVDSSVKVSIWDKIPKLTRSKSKSSLKSKNSAKSKAPASKYVASRFPNAAL